MPTGRPGITLAIPCFNAAGTLAAAIDSAIVQPGVECEIVIIDDGSTDNSLALARSFEPWVRVIAAPHAGVSAARNRGIAETTGEFLVFLDADDLLVPATLEKRLAAAKETDADVVICDWQEFTACDGQTTDGPVRSVDLEALSEDTEIACATHLWATTAALMYRRSLVNKIGGFAADLPVIQDARFLFDAARHGARFAHSPHIGARYRVSPTSLSRRDPSRFWRDVLLNGTQIEALWRARGPLSGPQCEALRQIFDTSARGLFATGDPDFFAAVARQRRLGLPLDRHPRIATPLARALGLGPARRLLRLVGR